MGREPDARKVYEKVLALDPDNSQAHIGLCRMALRRRDFRTAARSALDALQRIYHDPVAHFLLGRALAGIREYKRAAEAFRAAITFNPNFPEAHVRLASLLEKHLGDVESAREHRRQARSMRERRTPHPGLSQAIEKVEGPPVILPPDAPVAAATAGMPPLSESVMVVTGLPRSGTSMVMQMLAAGGADFTGSNSR